MPEGPRRMTKGSSATSARATSSRWARGWLGGTASTSGSTRMRRHSTSGPLTRWVVSSTSARRVASCCDTRPLSPTAVRWSTIRTRGWSRRKARIRPGTSHDPRLSGKASGDDTALGVDELVDGRQAVVEVVDQGVDVPLERRARVRHPQHPPGAAQQRGADLLLEPGQRPGDAGLAHAEDLTDLGHGVAVGDELEPAQRVGVHIHDDIAYESCSDFIGRMDRRRRTLDA